MTAGTHTMNEYDAFLKVMLYLRFISSIIRWRRATGGFLQILQFYIYVPFLTWREMAEKILTVAVKIAVLADGSRWT